MMNYPQPKVIFFDAVGTLFGVRGSVGEVYQEIALNHQVIINPDKINAAFYHCFTNAPPLAFGSSNPQTIPQQEFHWWRTLAIATFQQADFFDKFTDFDAFFQELYAYFATEKPWFIYPDVINTLETWHQKQVPLGIISNFDTRIYSVLKSLKLDKYFSSITISSEVGVAKPESKIFAVAVAKYSCQPQLAWHIGDNFIADYQGAKQFGIQAFWLHRDGNLDIGKNQLPNLNSLG